MREQIPCSVVGCNRTTTFASQLERQYGVALCDPDGDSGYTRAVAISRGQRPDPGNSHYLMLHAMDSMGLDCEEWVSQRCYVEFACGHSGRKSDDYLCPA